MDDEDRSMKGVVAEVGLRRDEDHFNSFNLTVSMILKSEGAMTYDEGERLMSQFRRDLLGKEVEITAITFPCPVCGKAFNTEQGMRQHMRMTHKKKKKAQPKEAKKKGRRRKTTKKRVSSKK